MVNLRSEERGSLTMFSSLFLVSLLLYFSLAINILQYFVDKRELQLTLQAASRSVMSSFDSELHEYGLYGTAVGATARNAVQSVLDQQQMAAKVTIQSKSDLSELAILRKQMVDSMEGLAPVNWLGEFMRRISDISPSDGASSMDVFHGKSGFPSMFSARRIALDAFETAILQAEKLWHSKRSEAVAKLQRAAIKLTHLKDLDTRISKHIKKWTGQSISPLQPVIGELESSIQSLLENSTNAVDEQFRMLKQQVRTLSAGDRNMNFTEGNNHWFPLQCRNDSKLLQNNYSKRFSTLDGTILQMNRWFETIQRAGKQMNENVLISEYALQHFNHRLSKRDQHKLQQQELEYIIIGTSSCDLNLIGVQAEIYAIRLLMRFTEFSLSPSLSQAAMTDPITFLVAAMSYAVTHAAQDLQQLMNGQSVPILEIEQMKAIGFTYQDYLRLLLMVTPEHNKLTRIQQCIENNLGRSLDTYSTEIALNASGHLNYALLPARFESFQLKSGYRYE